MRNGKPAAPLALELRYTSLDPFAVRITLQAAGASVCWSLARETLLQGVRRHEGVGDVAAWPVRHREFVLLRIRLGPPHCCAVVQADRDLVATWLNITTILVPPGTESTHMDWDSFLDSVLNDC
ncbi:SsgA family sporulation/cell division regulator [Streptomyces rectiviolaceus]|uniref:SsgA family sporulation/cell division regulator n=1 Tax=Streptomyces rectiviolaceus TaxID=332591 RepID=A0ABP6MH53_9ACTN